MIDASTKVKGDKNIVAGAFGSKVISNPPDNSKKWMYVTAGIVIIVIAIIAAIVDKFDLGTILKNLRPY